MLKNLKRLFVSVLVLIFSLACVVNLATYAGVTKFHYNGTSFYDLYPDYEDFDNPTLGSSCAKRCKQGRLPGGLQESLWELYYELPNKVGWEPRTLNELYITLCQNLCYLIKTPEDYNTVNGVISSAYRHWFGKDLKDEYIDVIPPLYEQVIKSIYPKATLNFFDIIWIYSIVSKNEDSFSLVEKENLEMILKAYNISPETFTPIY